MASARQSPAFPAIFPYKSNVGLGEILTVSSTSLLQTLYGSALNNVVQQIRSFRLGENVNLHLFNAVQVISCQVLNDAFALITTHVAVAQLHHGVFGNDATIAGRHI